MRTIYISGPMTGLEDFNFPAFFAAENKLIPKGWATFNPARYDIESGMVEFNGGAWISTDKFNLTEALIRDLEQVATCDAIFMLDGWEVSKGANAEIALARALGKEVIYQTPAPAGPVEEIAKPILLGIGGHLAAGKDAVADYLVDAYGFVKLGMSEPMVEIGKIQNPWILLDKPLQAGVHHFPQGEWVKLNVILETVGYTEAKTYREVRQYFQNLGSEIGRNKFGENVWTEMASDRIESLLHDGRSVVITGIRYPNELEMIHEFVEGHSLWVDRPGYEPKGDAAAHSSENGVQPADFNFDIYNGSTLETLYKKTDAILRATKGTK